MLLPLRRRQQWGLLGLVLRVSPHHLAQAQDVPNRKAQQALQARDRS
jgi:hypothetical protein